MTNQKLEDIVKIVNERNGIISNMGYVEKNPYHSYKQRKELGKLLNEDYPTEIQLEDYLKRENEVVLNNYLEDSIGKRNTAIIDCVKKGAKKYISGIDEKILAEMALSLDKEYMRYIAAKDNPEERMNIISETINNSERYMDLISLKPTQEEKEFALNRTYEIIVHRKKQELVEKNGLYEDIKDEKGKPKRDYDRENIEKYLLKNISAVDDEIKAKAYMGIASAYTAGKNKAAED